MAKPIISLPPLSHQSQISGVMNCLSDDFDIVNNNLANIDNNGDFPESANCCDETNVDLSSEGVPFEGVGESSCLSDKQTSVVRERENEYVDNVRDRCDSDECANNCVCSFNNNPDRIVKSKVCMTNRSQQNRAINSQDLIGDSLGNCGRCPTLPGDVTSSDSSQRSTNNSQQTSTAGLLPSTIPNVASSGHAEVDILANQSIINHSRPSPELGQSVYGCTNVEMTYLGPGKVQDSDEQIVEGGWNSKPSFSRAGLEPVLSSEQDSPASGVALSSSYSTGGRPLSSSGDNNCCTRTGSGLCSRVGTAADPGSARPLPASEGFVAGGLCDSGGDGNGEYAIEPDFLTTSADFSIPKQQNLCGGVSMVDCETKTDEMRGILSGHPGQEPVIIAASAQTGTSLPGMGALATCSPVGCGGRAIVSGIGARGCITESSLLNLGPVWDDTATTIAFPNTDNSIEHGNGLSPPDKKHVVENGELIICPGNSATDFVDGPLVPDTTPNNTHCLDVSPVSNNACPNQTVLAPSWNQCLDSALANTVCVDGGELIVSNRHQPARCSGPVVVEDNLQSQDVPLSFVPLDENYCSETNNAVGQTRSSIKKSLCATKDSYESGKQDSSEDYHPEDIGQINVSNLVRNTSPMKDVSCEILSHSSHDSASSIGPFSTGHIDDDCDLIINGKLDSHLQAVIHAAGGRILLGCNEPSSLDKARKLVNPSFLCDTPADTGCIFSEKSAFKGKFNGGKYLNSRPPSSVGSSEMGDDAASNPSSLEDEVDGGVDGVDDIPEMLGSSTSCSSDSFSVVDILEEEKKDYFEDDSSKGRDDKSDFMNESNLLALSYRLQMGEHKINSSSTNCVDLAIHPADGLSLSLLPDSGKSNKYSPLSNEGDSGLSQTVTPGDEHLETTATSSGCSSSSILSPINGVNNGVPGAATSPTLTPHSTLSSVTATDTLRSDVSLGSDGSSSRASVVESPRDHERVANQRLTADDVSLINSAVKLGLPSSSGATSAGDKSHELMENGGGGGLSSRNSRINPFLNSRPSIEEELCGLDTRLPEFDFAKLEAQLTSAAKEQELSQRKLMSDDVIESLAREPRFSKCYPPAPTTRPLRSNLATRLQSGMNLQICFMNDSLLEHEKKSRAKRQMNSGDIDDDDDDDEDYMEYSSDLTSDSCSVVPKSKSTPEFIHESGASSGPGCSGLPGLSSKQIGGISRSMSSSSDSSKRASDLRKAIQERLEEVEEENPTARQSRLEDEARVMLVKAKQAAHMQMEVERQQSMLAHKSPIEDVVGFPVGRKRLNRLMLMRMNITQLQIIVNDFHAKIETLNEELVHLLISRDNLHMEQDSMLVDIEDLMQHQSQDDLKLPEFLVAAPVSEQSNRWRLFKR